MKNVIIIAVFLILMAGLAGSVYAGYTGVGMIQTGGPSARVGSIGGPLIIGGGPGSGK
ncbi:MAG: hypothetical protein MUF87_20185 [Anaerolineae bacterium]|jgi:hypothetical protein|nr:hypothetical protein [Anaerolineae bacterium]